MRCCPGTTTIATAKDAPARRTDGASCLVRAASSVNVMNRAVSAKSRPSICVGMSDPARTPTTPDTNHVRWKYLHRQQARLRPPVWAGGGERVGLVHEGIHREEARDTPLDDVQWEREREKQEAEVHQQHRHRNDGQRRILRGQSDDEQLGRPRVGGQGERRSQPPRQAQLDDQQAVGQAQWDVTRGDGCRDA